MAQKVAATAPMGMAAQTRHRPLPRRRPGWHRAVNRALRTRLRPGAMAAGQRQIIPVPSRCFARILRITRGIRVNNAIGAGFTGHGRWYGCNLLVSHWPW